VVPGLHDVLQAVIELVPATNVEALRLTPAAFTVTAAVCVRFPEPVTAARIVFASALVDVKVELKTPLPFVVPDDGLNVQVVPTEHEGVTVLPLITLPN